MKRLALWLFGVVLVWNPPTSNVDGSPITDLARYRFYRSADRVSWAEVAEIPATEVEFLYPTPQPNRTDYIYMTAIDEAGNESGPSNEISLRVTSVCLKRCNQ